MNKCGRVPRSVGFMPSSQVSSTRFEQRFGLAEALLLLILVLTLAACGPDSGDEWNGEPVDDPSSPNPIVTAPVNITVAATNAGGTAAGNATITAFLNAASANDAVDGPIPTINNDAPAVFPLGTTTVTFSAIDSDGNTGSAQATVTVSDQDAPVITLLGLASITLNVGDPFTDPGATATDNVDGNLTPAIVAGGSVNTAAVEIYTLTYDVSDTAANAAVQATRSVSVQDAGAPVVTPPAPITVAAVDASGTPDSEATISAFLLGASALDAVDGVIVPTNNAPTQFPLGVTTVTFSATDGSGNTGLAQATVTISDQTAPVVTAPADIMVAATGPGGIAAGDPAIVAFLNGASATDNVDGAIATITNNAPGTLPVGVNTVTFSATDAALNTGNAQATVTVSAFASVQMIAFSRDVGGGELDLFAIAEDGSGSEVTLADDTGDEVFAGWSSDNRVIYVRDTGGGLNDIFSINDDGSGVPLTLANDARDELPVAVTAANQVIFMRGSGAPPDADLLSITADGSSGEVSLAVTADAELFGGLTSDGRVVYDSTSNGLTDADVYSIFADGTGGVTLAANPEFEAGGGIASGTLVVFARTVAGLPSHNDIFTREADGLSAESPLVSTLDDELPVGVTSSDLVIFMRTSGFTFSLWSIGASGTPVAVQLASADGSAGDFLAYGGFTGGRVIYDRCNLFSGFCDVFSRNADGSGPEATLAANPGLNESFAGISSDGLIIIVRDNGATTDLISMNADGTGANVLATVPTPVPPAEVFKGVTANGRVIFERSVSGQTDLFSILADDSAPEVPLATAAGSDETFGGVF